MMAILILIVVIVIRCEARVTSESKTALLGCDVALNCSPDLAQHFHNVADLGEVDCSNNFIHWTKVNESGSYTLSNCIIPSESTLGRITLNMTQTLYTMGIQNVQINDIGKYICHTYDKSISDGQKTVRNVNLSVVAPQCYVRPRYNVHIGDDVTLNCTLPTPRRLKLIAPNGTILSSFDVTPLQTSLILTVTVREEDNFESFTCVAVSPHGAYNPNCSVTPLKHTGVSITPEVSNVREGDSAVFNCKAKLSPRKPHRYNYTWMVNSAVVSQGLNFSSYTVSPVRLADNGTKVKCEASVNTVEDESYVAVIYVHPTVRLSTRSLDNAETVEFGVTNKIPLSTTRHSKNEVGYETHNPEHDETKNATNVSFIVGGVVAIVVLFVLALILMVVLMKKKTRKTQRGGDTEVAAAGTPSTETTAQVADNPTREHDNTVIYALPLQKGGGSMKVRTLGVSFNTPSSSSTAVKSATTSTLETTDAEMSLNGNTESVHDNEVLYALPSQKGGGNIKVRTLINKSSTKSSSEGRSSAAANEARMATNSISNVSDVQISTATDDEILYALPSQKGGGYVKARTLDGASKRSSVSAVGRFSTVDKSSTSKPTISKISSVQTIDTTESDEVVYALPSQKGGGSINVRTLDASSKKSSPSATTRSNEAGRHIAARATFLNSSGGQFAKPSSTTKDDEDVYALPSQKGGGHIKVQTLDASYRT